MFGRFRNAESVSSSVDVERSFIRENDIGLVCAGAFLFQRSQCGKQSVICALFYFDVFHDEKQHEFGIHDGIPTILFPVSCVESLRRMLIQPRLVRTVFSDKIV